MVAICAHFLWGNAEAKEGLHWKSWEYLCKRKEEGGMGFRRFGCFNKALLAKQVWRMISQPNLLVSKIFKARYFKDMDIMHVGLGNNPSFTWRSLCWGRELIREGIDGVLEMERILMQGIGIGLVPGDYLKHLLAEFKIRKCQPILM